MAAAQVAKKLKDKRQQRTIEGIFKKVSNICLIFIIFLLLANLKQNVSKISCRWTRMEMAPFRFQSILEYLRITESQLTRRRPTGWLDDYG